MPTCQFCMILVGFCNGFCGFVKRFVVLVISDATVPNLVLFNIGSFVTGASVRLELPICGLGDITKACLLRIANHCNWNKTEYLGGCCRCWIRKLCLI
ncbi:hypothetical protein AKJ16_DCAP10526 [Drosera capensis]